jgi:CBS domain-containing protein
VRIQEIMTPNPACCTTETTVRDVANLMREFDCGSIPVVQTATDRRLVGLVTDRDLTVRGLAQGIGPDAAVGELMTPNPTSCQPDDEVETVREVMVQQKVRRVPVVDANGIVVGIVAQADVALEEGAASDRELGRIVEAISEPDRGDLRP